MIRVGLLIYWDMRESAESSADNAVKTAVESLRVQDWKASRNPVTVFVLC